MLINAEELTEPGDVHAQIVIAGAGLAGLTLAKKLAKHADVVVLERGGSDLSAPSEDGSTEAVSSGISYPFATTRDFRLGGSTSIWAGFCAEFDDFDFTERHWVPFSGWPFGHDELAPYRSDVGDILNMSATEFDPLSISEHAKVSLPAHIDGLNVTSWRFGDPTLRILDDWSFQEGDLSQAQTITHARVVNIQLTKDHSAVDHFLCRTRAGREFKAKADVYILAMGGLETARLLLASNTQAPRGVANSSDMVGRCFLEHPHIVVDGFQFNANHPLESWAEKGLDSAGSPFALCTGLSYTDQESLHLLNHRAHIFRTPDMSLNDVPGLGLFLEQSPNPESRISLRPDLDDWGVPKLDLQWRLTDLDLRSYADAANQIAECLHHAGAGEITHSQNASDIKNDRILHSNHQLGTTRMSADPEAGAVDENCRTHDHDNLYITGGSIFPTVSWANPSFTMLLVTLRLAEKLKQSLE